MARPTEASVTLARAYVARYGPAAVFVTHDVTETARLASRIVVLSAAPGRLVADLVNAPEPDPARAFARASALLARPKVAVAQY